MHFNPPPQRAHKTISYSWFNMFTNRLKQNSENETKFVQDRINLAERNVAELAISFGAYSRKSARLRDVGDELTTILQNYATAETINQSFSNGLSNFATTLNTVNSYGDKRVQYIDNKVVSQLTPYEATCKNMRDGVKNIFITKDKEMVRQRQLDRIKERNPRNRQQIVEAESELVQAKSEVAKTIHNLEDKLLTFERQKLHDLKEILLDFVCTEIGYHSKVISLLTEAYATIDAINIESDVEDLQRVFDELDPVKSQNTIYKHDKYETYTTFQKFKASLRDPKTKHEGKSLSKHSQSLGTINAAGRKGIQDDSKKRKPKAVSEEVLNQDDESEVSESEYTESDSENSLSRGEKKLATKKYLH